MKPTGILAACSISILTIAAPSLSAAQTTNNCDVIAISSVIGTPGDYAVLYGEETRVSCVCLDPGGGQWGWRCERHGLGSLGMCVKNLTTGEEGYVSTSCDLTTTPMGGAFHGTTARIVGTPGNDHMTTFEAGDVVGAMSCGSTTQTDESLIWVNPNSPCGLTPPAPLTELGLLPWNPSWQFGVSLQGQFGEDDLRGSPNNDLVLSLGPGGPDDLSPDIACGMGGFDRVYGDPNDDGAGFASIDFLSGGAGSMDVCESDTSDPPWSRVSSDVTWDDDGFGNDTCNVEDPVLPFWGWGGPQVCENEPAKHFLGVATIYP